MHIGLKRRLGIALVALAGSVLLFHLQIASLLVSRGDDFSRSGRLDRAAIMYTRALWMDRTSIVAADRLAFLGIREHSIDGYRQAEITANAALRLHPQDPHLLLDRALANEHLGNYRLALADFDRLGSIDLNARSIEFAAQMALRLHDRRGAHERFARVLAMDSRFLAARRGWAATR